METVPRVRFGLLPSDLEIRCTLTVQKNLPFFEQRAFSVCKVVNALWSEVITIMCGNVSCVFEY